MRFERTYIKVDGPARAGKTSLIERLLASNRSKTISVARFAEAESLSKPTGECSDNDETKRFKAVGAYDTVLYRYICGQEDEAERWFWDSEFMSSNYSDGIIVEGQWQLDFPADLSVFVTRPLDEDEPLLVREMREVSRLSFKDYISIVSGMDLGDEPIILEKAEGLSDGDLLAAEDEIIDERGLIEIPDEEAEILTEHIKHGVPVHKEGWFVKESHSGLAEALVVVINIHGEHERPAAERLLREIRRVREDEKIMRDILGGWVSRRSQSAYIANLADPRDKELKKALSRIKRAAFGR